MGKQKRLVLCGRAAAGRDDTAALRGKMRIATKVIQILDSKILVRQCIDTLRPLGEQLHMKTQRDPSKNKPLEPSQDAHQNLDLNSRWLHGYESASFYE